METTTTVLISGVVLAAVQVFKQFAWCSQGVSLTVAIALSLVFTLLYAFSHETGYQPILLWNYATGFVAIAGTAVGVHSAAKNTKEIVQDAADARRNSGTGTGN